MWLINIYGFILIAACFFILFRREAVLLRITAFFKFNLIFAAVAAILLLFQFLAPSIYFLIFLILLALVTYLFLNVWIVFHYKTDEFTKNVEGALGMILFPFEKNEYGYILKHSNGEASILIRHPMSRIAIIRFKTSNDIKKVDVLKALLIKRFNKIFPRLTIHLK